MRFGVFISFYCGSFITKHANVTRYTAILALRGGVADL
jgi:hypothetical protein